MNLKEAFQVQNKLESLIVSVSDYLSDANNLIDTSEKNLRPFPPDKVIEFLIVLLQEREKFSRAIHCAKTSVEFDLDDAIDVNKKRRLIADTLTGLHINKSSAGFKSVDVDCNRLREIISDLQVSIDRISTYIDNALVSATVDYEFPFDMQADDLEILENYITAE